MLFLNEWSLEGQFESASAFLANLRIVLKCQRESRSKGFPMHVRKSLVCNAATPDATFADILYSTRDRDFIAQVRIWLMRDGPFWDEPKEHSEVQFYECLGELVTDSSLAEAAWHQDQAGDAAAFSFSFTQSRFSVTPLIVWWRERPEGDSEHSIANFWESNPLSNFLDTQKRPCETWEELFEHARGEFSRLQFVDDILDELKSRPFVVAIANRALELLRVLNELNERIAIGDTENEKAILATYFSGSRPWFSGESEGRENDANVRRRMTFCDPRTGGDLYCPWHGKISHQYFRLHFEWPKVDREAPMLIAYLGPHR